MAKDCLAGYINYIEEKGEEILKASIPYTSNLEENSFVQLIEAYLPPYRDELYNKMERKNKLLRIIIALKIVLRL